MKRLSTAAALILAVSAAAEAVYADVVSPAIRDRGKVYSKETPDTSFYGTGIGGRAMEASVLRMDVERLLQDGHYDIALKKIRKAVQFEPADPDGHLLLARTLTKNLNTKAGPLDEKMLGEAIYEWRLLWLHDADQSDQMEAKYNCLRLMRIQHRISKEKEMEAKARMKAKKELALQRAKEAQEQAQDSTQQADTRQVADRKKRFWLF